jgi:hypothetical protein
MIFTERFECWNGRFHHSNVAGPENYVEDLEDVWRK